MKANKKDEKRLKKQIADKDGVRDGADDIFTRKDTDDLPMEDTHDNKIPNGDE
jgi:hypothetical protein